MFASSLLPQYVLSYLAVLQNISPAHAPDIVIYIDAITIVFEEASKGGQPSPLPIACIEAGEYHSLPNLALRYWFTLAILIFCPLLLNHAIFPNCFLKGYGLWLLFIKKKLYSSGCCELLFGCVCIVLGNM